MTNFLFSLILLILPLQLQANPADIYPFNQSQQKLRFHRLITEFRCLVCQNENLAESNAKLANDLRDIIYHQVKRGDSDTMIKQFLVKRYGNFILYRPPVQTNTYLLWGAPFMFLLAGFIALWILIKKKGRE